MLYGGGLSTAAQVKVWRVADGLGFPGEAGAPSGVVTVPVVQASEESVKFVLPTSLRPGVFGTQVMTAKAVILNRPELWFMQPVRLQPGLEQNQATAVVEVQIVGKDFLLPGDLGKPRIALRAKGDRRWIEVPVSKQERFSLRAKLPAELREGAYELWVQNGFGGAAGWGGPLPIEIKQAAAWPAKAFDVKKDFGAKGDDVTDDTAAIAAALDAARQNGGGVVYLPYGIYRLSKTIVIPPHTVVRGELRDATVLMWPVDEPKTFEEFSQAAIFAQAPYAVEDLSVIARKVNYLLEDVSFGQGVPAELLAGHGECVERDVFLRRLNLQHWIVAGRGTGATLGNKYAMDGVNVLGINGVTNFELSDTQMQGGGVHIRNIRNARETGNSFSNSMGYVWAEMGGGAHYVVSEDNEIRASSSWGYGHIAMKYVYSAHNHTYNFVRGEREAMTLDISALPTGKPGRNIAWFGKPAKVEGTKFTINGIKALPNEFAGLHIMILNGPGRGQFREIVSNAPAEFIVDRAWDVQPDETSTIGLWSVMQHMIVYKSEGYDCSAFAQLWGSYYDYIVDSNRVERNQGIWGQNGWFVQFRYNDVLYANTYHPGIGPGGGPTPEKTLPFSFVGLTGGGLRVTKFGSSQYDRPLVMVDDVAGGKVPGTLGAIIKGNRLRYNQRVALPPSAQPTTKDNGEARMFDLVVDDNTIEHSVIGIQIGPQTRGVVVNNNHLVDVARPYAISRPESVKVIEGR
jgi:Pectate lyase superfamily protein